MKKVAIIKKYKNEKFYYEGQYISHRDIIALIKSNVNVKCYLFDPKSKVKIDQTNKVLSCLMKSIDFSNYFNKKQMIDFIKNYDKKQKTILWSDKQLPEGVNSATI